VGHGGRVGSEVVPRECRLEEDREARLDVVSVRWRKSGGRGEWEYVPSHSLDGKRVFVAVPSSGVRVSAFVVGRFVSGKPRLRKTIRGRDALHLVPLVMAMARLPDPAREDHGDPTWPLENKGFVVSEMTFAVVDGDATSAVLEPLTATILHSPERVFDLQSRFRNVDRDAEDASDGSGELARAIQAHASAVRSGQGVRAIRAAADEVQRLVDHDFGVANYLSVSEIGSLPLDDGDGPSAPEGRILTRLHRYRERNRSVVREARDRFRKAHGGVLRCEACGVEPSTVYGPRGIDRLHAHHVIPVSELLPDSETSVSDLVFLCPNCHDIVHAARPWLSLDELRAIIAAQGLRNEATEYGSSAR
jgi:predicted HNH restriction endonuclease